MSPQRSFAAGNPRTRRVPSLCLIFLLGLLPQSKAAEQELHVRAGLPTLAARITTGGELRVAYLGGSITAAADGWRSLTTSYLQQHYPQLNVVEIAAGLPGTGSNLGACRMGNDVLRHHPDVMFVEFAVNDGSTPPDHIERTMEGIVRQARRSNPAMDLWFVYTIATPVLPDLEAGRFQPSAQAMERVADHYRIPSLHFGIEVARRVVDGRLLFKPVAPNSSGSGATTPSSVSASVSDSDSTPVFALDGTHPTAAGHRLYFGAIERSLPNLLRPAAVGNAAKTLPASRQLPAPLHADNWEFATLRLMDAVTRRGSWIEVPRDDANLRGVTKALLPPTFRTDVPGASIEFEFKGKKFGLLGIGAPDSGQFRVMVDELPPVTDTFFDSYATPTFCRQREWFFPTDLADGPHRVRVEFVGAVADKLGIKSKAGRPATTSPEAYALNRLTLCGALVVGSSAP